MTTGTLLKLNPFIYQQAIMPGPACLPLPPRSPQACQTTPRRSLTSTWNTSWTMTANPTRKCMWKMRTGTTWCRVARGGLMESSITPSTRQCRNATPTSCRPWPTSKRLRASRFRRGPQRRREYKGPFRLCDSTKRYGETHDSFIVI